MDTFLLMNDLGDFVQVHLSNYQKLNTFGQGNAYNPIVGSEKQSEELVSYLLSLRFIVIIKFFSIHQD